MKSHFTLLATCLCLTVFVACKKEDGTDDPNKNDTDLTTNIIGTYSNPATNTNVEVTKVNNAMVYMDIVTKSGSRTFDVTFDQVKLTEGSSSFKLDTMVNMGYNCGGWEHYFGTGSYNNDTIKINMKVVGEPYGNNPCQGSINVNFWGTK